MASQGLYVYLNVGVFQGKLADGRRHHAQAQRRRAGKAQNAAARPAHCIDARLDTFQPQEMALYGVEQFVRLGRGPKSTVQHVEQRRSEEHTSALQSLMRISYDVFCLK